ncbi:hypothetical protein ABEB36_000216 [Hypothenemus hampei]|uniref:HTH psq-type domain-containing protein n=1 Tax=Hypothenemus hampei TaxID=57062 RepID=A0ABD1FAJ2_HYPHA
MNTDNNNNNKVKRTSLSIEDRCKILERTKVGESATQLPLEYKVTRQAISKIKNSESVILRAKHVLSNCEGNLKKKPVMAGLEDLKKDTESKKKQFTVRNYRPIWREVKALKLQLRYEQSKAKYSLA